MLRALSLIILLFFSAQAQAIIAVSAHGGTAFSVFSKGEAESLKGSGFTLGASICWQPGKGEKLSPFSLGLIARQTKINYVENAINKRGTYLAMGPEIGVYKDLSESLGLQFLLHYATSPSLTTVSSNKVSLNEETFHYSTWENYKGSGAMGGRLAFIHDKVSGQFSKKNRFRSGLGLSYSTQSFKTSVTEVSSSKEALKPSITSTTNEVDFRFNLIIVDLFLGISF